MRCRSGSETAPSATDGTPVTCPFCRVSTREDETGLVVHRGGLAFVVLNLYLYSPGHLLICPYRHVADYTDLIGDERLAMAGSPPGR